jgi:prephenate dehydratase
LAEEVISMSASGQPASKVAFQGEHGAFSEDAARKLLGSQAITIPFRKFDDMFDAVSTGQADSAIVPIENSLAGSVHQNYDLMMEHELTIVGETYLRIVHNLIASPGVPLSGIRRVYSHPVALAQCGKFLRANKQIEAEAAYDTAGSVRMIMASGSPTDAAIAGHSAAIFYGAKVLAEGIEDNPQNFTRFLLLTRSGSSSQLAAPAQTERRKTSIVFRVANTPGALYKALAAFALRDVDLCKIESRPIEGRPWEYSFYLDFEGDQRDVRVDRAIAHLAEMAESIRVLGSYPSASY